MSILNKSSRFGNRLKHKESLAPSELGILKFERGTAIYKRLSTHEQVHTSRFSLERQHRLESLAVKDGYRATLSEEEIARLRAQADYRGFYQNGAIWVIESDLGISGTKGQEGRPGLALLTHLIETNQIESVYTVDITRLFRDSDLVHASAFGHLCKAHAIIVITDAMRFDLRHEMHYNFFLQLAQFAGQELKTIMQRLGNSRALKSQMGLYAGGAVATGFYVDLDPKSPTFEQYKAYPPHAKVINELFQIAAEKGSMFQVLREVRHRNLYFPLFEPGIGAWMNSRSGLRFCEPQLDESGNQIGYQIHRSLLGSIFTNPAYAGFPIRINAVLEEGDHPVLVDRTLFALVFDRIVKSRTKPRGKLRKSEPYLLQGYLFSLCRDGKIRPAYHDSYEPRNTIPGVSGGHLHCPCGTDQGYCFRVRARAILTPLSEHVLSRIAFPEVADEVRRRLTEDYQQSAAVAQAYKRERQRLKDEIDTIKHNLAMTRLDSSAVTFMEQEIENRVNELRLLEIKSMQPYSESPISADELNFVTSFLTDLRTHWNDIPLILQNRLFQLILEKVVIQALEDTNFLVHVHWKAGPVDVLWIERPLWCSGRHVWTNEEKDLLRQHFLTSDVRTITQMYPGKLWDSIREQAKRLGLRRIKHWGLMPWTDDEDAIIHRFVRQQLTHKEMRQALPHRREIEIDRRLAILNLKKPSIPEIVWRLVNTEENESLSPALSVGYFPAPSAPH